MNIMDDSWMDPNLAEIPASVEVTDSEGRPRRQPDILLDLGCRHELFHAPDGTAYARTGVAVHAVESPGYREVLAGEYFALTERGCNRNALSDAVTTLTSIAKFRGECRKVWMRVGDANDGRDGCSAVCIDPGRDDWRIIEVTADGWHWSQSPPMFRRSRAFGKMPEPATPDFGRLWKYLNAPVALRPLVAAFLLSAMRPRGPYPVLVLEGEQGTGKSTFSRVLKMIADPSAALVRSPPKDTRDLLVGALNAWLLALDNLSFLGPDLSDSLCRIATGGAISERALYSNTDEVLVEVQRPVVLNGIEDLAVRPDLAERSLHIELDLIRERRTESEFWESFAADLPHILGGLLAGISMAIRDHRNVRIERLPRMADFAVWSAAGMPALGFTADEFLNAYSNNLDEGLGAGVDGSPMGRVLLSFIRARAEWSGTAAELLSALAGVAEESTVRSQGWPRSPRGLSGAIRRLAPALRLQGIEITTDRNATARNLRLCSTGKQPSQPSQPSFRRESNDANDANDGHPASLHKEPCPHCAGEGCAWCRP
ncbi:hypothetical protein [Pseudoxanthomonas koreensis]|uniref:hypothetical protein n=1 Tax=Pseudoxanthomonas koreensis TaxID=266061 RepID=UPI001391141C|nr:hypothetical protein [Pseudoxanthomonas koreensis]KAF1691850.1 hypothetical protein CSC64_08015 [Pseudoxanthomonas koreensis]